MSVITPRIYSRKSCLHQPSLRRGATLLEYLSIVHGTETSGVSSREMGTLSLTLLSSPVFAKNIIPWTLAETYENWSEGNEDRDDVGRKSERWRRTGIWESGKEVTRS